MLAKTAPDEAERLLAAAQARVTERWAVYEHLAALGGPVAVKD